MQHNFYLVMFHVTLCVEQRMVNTTQLKPGDVPCDTVCLAEDGKYNTTSTW